MRNISIVFVLGISALLLSGCASDTEVTTTTQTTPADKSAVATKTPDADGLTATSAPSPSSDAVTRTEVKWGDYQTGLQADIDLMTTNQDCQGLQTYFGMVTATEESVKTSYGHGNEALQKYLDESVALAGCG